MWPGPTVTLYDLRGLGLIVKRPSGVLYTTQAGGVFCMQPGEEGVLVPLAAWGDVEAKLVAFFAADARRNVKLDAADAGALDLILQTSEPRSAATPTFFLAVDRARLADSMEAWLHVTVTACPDERIVSYLYDGTLSMVKTLSGRAWHPSQQPELGDHASSYPLTGFGRAAAVLTWENSD